MVRWKAHRQGYPAHVVLAVGHVMRPRKAGLKFGRSTRPVRLPAKNFRRAEAARETRVLTTSGIRLYELVVLRQS